MPEDVQLITRALFDRVLAEARQNPRRRQNYNFHASLDENPSRFLNVMLQGTYVTPHRHIDPPKSESFVILEGRVAFFLFDGNGRVTERVTLGPAEESIGIDVRPGLWHTLAVLSEHAICFEVKPGPYTAMNDKSFAPWAPREGDAACAAFLEHLLSATSSPAVPSSSQNRR